MQIAEQDPKSSLNTQMSYAPELVRNTHAILRLCARVLNTNSNASTFYMVQRTSSVLGRTIACPQVALHVDAMSFRFLPGRNFPMTNTDQR